VDADSADAPTASADDRFRVVIAGSGVAGVEALLALRHLLRTQVSIELVSGSPEFAYRPLALAEPFGLGEATRLRVDALAADQGATFRPDLLASVDPERRAITTESGVELTYDALLLAVGARGVEHLPGALTYGGANANDAYRALLSELESGAATRVVFAVVAGLHWALPLYELALLTMPVSAGWTASS
jgi:sulfide:quinone oxidoreductase